MNILKKYWKIIALIIFAIFLVYRFYQSFSKKEITTTKAKKQQVELVRINQNLDSALETSCSVEASSDAPVLAELSGKVTAVYAKNGQKVKSGQKIFRLENLRQRIAVQNARVSLRSAELALSELLDQNNKAKQNSLLTQTIEQQKLQTQQAKRRLFNNDLRAYPQGDVDEIATGAPIISGDYHCDKKGTYELRVYGSSARSGASFVLSGLESGRDAVSTTDFSVPLGSCGLEIRFPKNFKEDQTWIIPVPNTRSGSYLTVKNAYEQSLSGKDIAINRTQAKPQQIARERARVRQAQLQIASAENELAKTIVRANAGGVLSGFDLQKGDFVNAQSELARIKTIDQIKLITYVDAQDARYFSSKLTATVEGKATKILSIAPTVDSTKKVKVTIAAPDMDLVEGTQVSCSLNRDLGLLKKSSDDNSGIEIPLSAISVIGVDTYVFELKDSVAVAKPIQAGALLGDTIVVHGLSAQEIIRDARGIRDGEMVILKK